MKRVYVIAEAGVNHNGSVETAKALVRAAAESGADAIKFQTFRTDSLVTSSALTADYQKRQTGIESQWDLLRGLELPGTAYQELVSLCATVGLDFISSAFDLASVEMLADLGLNVWKIPSGEVTNLPYLRAIAGHAVQGSSRVFLSTGMCELVEVREAISTMQSCGVLPAQIVVLHCVTDYPARLEDVNLRAMQSMKEELGLAVGYSDHTEGISVPMAATALGAVVIEKHLTLDRNMDGPDHRASIEPGMFSSMVRGIREIELALGSNEKHPSNREAENRRMVRKSIVASQTIRAGEALSEANLTTKRPGTGVSPMRWDEVLGQTADRNYEIDDEIVI